MNDLDPIDAGQGESTIDSQSADPSPTPSPAPAASPSPSADQFYEVKIGGQTRKVPLNELLSGYSRTQDYTQKTMALAEERRQLESKWEGERQQLREYLSKQENLQQLLQLVQQRNSPQDPSQPLTLQQLQQMKAQENQQLEQRFAQERQSMQLEHLTNSFDQDISTHIKGILAQHPELGSIRRIDQVLRQEALAKEPATIEEAKSAILEAAQEQLAELQKHFQQQQKVAAVNQSTLKKGIEPPGGHAPAPAGKSFKLGDPRLRDDAADYLRQMMAESVK